MPGEGDDTALPLFRREEDSSLFSFWREDPLGFAAFLRSDVEDSFLVSRDITLFLAGGHMLGLSFAGG